MLTKDKAGASEKRGVAEALEHLEEVERRHLPVLLARLRRRLDLPDGARVLEIGAAQGTYLTALTRLGFEASGIEPWFPAIENSRELAKRTGVEPDIVHGAGEDLSAFEDESFDLVLAISVMEHVDDPLAVCREAQRVLKPGGGFYFYTGSRLHPRQVEIARFPLFPWYPTRVQRRIMRWAAEKRPHLVGHTEKPAMHWFTPWGTRRMLREAGFSAAYERWELADPSETRTAKARVGTKVLHRFPPAKIAAAFLDGAIAFLAIK
ncbi:MAG TPA: methyltransferase domain-containing protein [Thermoleophilaceae bacterium]